MVELRGVAYKVNLITMRRKSIKIPPIPLTKVSFTNQYRTNENQRKKKVCNKVWNAEG